MAAAAALALGANPAGAQDNANESDACFTAAERAQPLMKDKRFREARAELEMCARDVCPRVARSDCRDWLAEVALEQPSIVIAAHEVNPRRETRDVSGVRATIDGGITIERVDGAPVPLDPGRHRVRIERAGLEPLEQTVEVRDGEKNRVVNFYWQTQWVAPRRAQDVPVAPPPAPVYRPTPASVYLFGVLGLAAVGAGTYLEIVGLSDRSTLSKCTPICPQPQVDDARDTTRAGDITVGVGIAMLAGATILYLTRPAEPSTPPGNEVGLLVGPMPGGGVMAGLRGSL